MQKQMPNAQVFTEMYSYRKAYTKNHTAKYPSIGSTVILYKNLCVIYEIVRVIWTWLVPY